MSHNHFRRWPMSRAHWVVFFAVPTLFDGIRIPGPWLAVMDDFGDLVLVDDESHALRLGHAW